eukprot:TRINITY_DN825_c0_g1_i1.p1 TRINITY_DN825_c0_g1~~TRINITY_DN825_c0_g1_i1.p1  ORF type:complete len:449 (-),score=74.59 TRINITY_DN825_c0_g1_i1:489-1835(-)
MTSSANLDFRTIDDSIAVSTKVKQKKPSHPEDRIASIQSFGEFGGVNASIEASTTYTVLRSDELPQIFSGKKGVKITSFDNLHSGGFYLYSRHLNPTVLLLGREVAAMEGAEAGYPCASGMAAIACTLLSLCSAGDHIVCSNTVYGGTFALLKDTLPKFKIETTFVDITNLKEVQAAINVRTKVVYTETISNPTLKVADIRSISRMIKKYQYHEGVKIQLVVDNTFSPLIMTPIKHGADIVVHSMTKFINGASDIIAGCICGRTSFIRSLMDLHQGTLMLLGPVMDPKTAFEISLRFPHLPLRMKEHSRRALAMCQRLQKLGVEVQYPGLPSHPQYKLFKKLANIEYGAGAIFTIDAKSRKVAFDLMDDLQNKEGFGYNAVSLGYFTTLMSCSSATTSSELSDEDLRKAGIAPGLIRFSLGYTGTYETRMKQLENALSRVGLIRRSKL